MPQSNWRPGNFITTKKRKATVMGSDLSRGQNWVTIQCDGQQEEGYQADFEAKGWKKPELTLDHWVAAGFIGMVAMVGTMLIVARIVPRDSVSEEPSIRPTTSVIPSSEQSTSVSEPSSSPLQRPIKRSRSTSLTPMFEGEKQEIKQRLARIADASSTPVLERQKQSMAKRLAQLSSDASVQVIEPEKQEMSKRLTQLASDLSAQVLEGEKQSMAKRLAQYDGASSAKPYAAKITQLGKACYELEKGEYSRVELVAPEIGSLALFMSSQASKRGFKISNLEVLQILEQALQTNPQGNCSTTLFVEMQRRYPQQWK
ncbi:MAG: hypothetical protein AB1589_12220 [Cyanobacteriota bacterium]